MAAAPLGAARCPLCGGDARVSLSKSGYAVMTMNCCNAQLFSRSAKSDELVRDLIVPAGAQAAPPQPDPVRTDPEPQPQPAPVRTESGGLMSSWFR